MESTLWAELAREQVHRVHELIRTIVPYPPGSYADLVARTVSTQLGLTMGRPTFTENLDTVNGAAAIQLVASLVPQRGAVLLLGGPGPVHLNHHVHLAKPLLPVAEVCRGTNVLVVAASSEWTSVAQVLSAANTSPGQLSYVSSGTGSFQHALGATFAAAASLNLRHSPRRNLFQAVQALQRGKANLLWAFGADLLPFLRADELRPIAVTGPQRCTVFPDVPTVREVGLADCETESWLGYFVSGYTDSKRVNDLSEAINSVLERPDMNERVSLHDVVKLSTSSQEAFSHRVQLDADVWRRRFDSMAIRWSMVNRPWPWRWF